MPIVNDVSQLNPIEVFAVATPRSTAEVAAALRQTRLPVSIGGGHFSLGGQTASPASLHLDLRLMNRVLQFDPQGRSVRVEAGICWCDLQRFIDPHGLAVKIMQRYANFTVGGSLAVNAHGPYVGLGPLVHAVRGIQLVLASGEVVDAAPDRHAELFYAAVGGYGAIGVITEVDLDLVPNGAVQRRAKKLRASDYPQWFDCELRGRPAAVFHEALLYAPRYTRLRAVTWYHCTGAPASPRLQSPAHRLRHYLRQALAERWQGRRRSEWLIDPLRYLRRKQRWRNYEAGRDVAQLQAWAPLRRQLVLQEYFVPVARLAAFLPRLAAVLAHHAVSATQISIRHAAADPGTLLAWARSETFAVVLQHRQGQQSAAQERVAVWTRELIDAVLDCGGTYYLPFQLYATAAQFHRAYPRAAELFALKRRVDPDYRLRNALWDKYYLPSLDEGAAPQVLSAPESLFHRVYSEVGEADRFYAFLHKVFCVYPHERLHALIKQAIGQHREDEAIYREIQAGLASLSRPFAVWRARRSALLRQRREMGRQTAQLLDGVGRSLQGYVEIGSAGTYLDSVRKQLGLSGPCHLVDEAEPSLGLRGLAERSGLREPAAFSKLDDYAPLPLPDASAGFIGAYTGLHHLAPSKLLPFLSSLARVLRPGGFLVLREHDVADAGMEDFVALAQTVSNAGRGKTWAFNAAQRRHFASADEWIARIEAVGFQFTGTQLFAPDDPSDNALMAFRRAD